MYTVILKRVLTVTPVKLVALFSLFPTLFIVHEACVPQTARLGYPQLLVYSQTDALGCASLSQWIWTDYDRYAMLFGLFSFNGVRIWPLVIVAIPLFSLVAELRRSRPGAVTKPRLLSWLGAMLVVAGVCGAIAVMVIM